MENVKAATQNFGAGSWEIGEGVALARGEGRKKMSQASRRWENGDTLTRLIGGDGARSRQASFLCFLCGLLFISDVLQPKKGNEQEVTEKTEKGGYALSRFRRPRSLLHAAGTASS